MISVKVNGGPVGPITHTMSELSGTVSISRDGWTLSANTAALDGNGTITYQWLRGTAQVGSGGSTYPIQITDAGNTITVNVSREGYTGSITSNGIAIPALSATISGTTAVGSTLTAVPANFPDSTYTYQWQRGASQTGTFADIGGATGENYALTVADANQWIQVVVSQGGATASGGPVGPALLLPLTGTVSIVRNGNTITANTGSLGGNGTITYQWMRGNVQVGTNNTYSIESADLGYTITVEVSRAGNSGSVTSNGISVTGGSFTINFFDADISTNIPGPTTVSILRDRSDPPKITVLNADKFDGNVSWYLRSSRYYGMLEGSHRETIILNHDFHENQLGTYILTVEVRIGGVPYSKAITINVVP